MFAIKVMRDSCMDYDVYGCDRFSVQSDTSLPTDREGLLLTLYRSGDEMAQAVSVPEVAYVMNDRGATIDTIRNPQRGWSVGHALGRPSAP